MIFLWNSMISAVLTSVYTSVKSFISGTLPPTRNKRWHNKFDDDDDDSEMEEPNVKKRRQPMDLFGQPSGQPSDDDFDCMVASSEVNERHMSCRTTGVASWIVPKQQSFEKTYSVCKQTADSVNLATARDTNPPPIEVVDVENSGTSSCGRLARLPIHTNEIQPKIMKAAEMLQPNEPIFIDLTEEVKEDPSRYVKQNSSKISESDPKRSEFSKPQFKYMKHPSGEYNRNQLVEKFVRQHHGFHGRTAKECIRLGEKEVYRKLMQDQTSILLPDVMALGFTQVKPSLPTNYKKRPDEVGIANLSVRTEKLSAATGEEMKRRCSKRHSTPLVDLTKSVRENQSLEKPHMSPKTKEGIEKFHLLDVEKSYNVGKSSENDALYDDVVIVGDSSPTDAKSPRWNRRRSQVHTKESCYTDPTWLADFSLKCGSDRLAYEHAIKEQTQKASEAAKRKDESQKLCAKLKNKHSIKDIVSGVHEIDIIDITPDEDDLIEALPELSSDMLSAISAALRPSPANEVLVEGFGIPVARRDMHTLDGTIWLNDAVINFYMNLLIERGKLDNFPSVHAFSTFFYTKLKKDGYNSLRRWTKKVDIFAHDYLVVPVHLGLHWCLAVADFKKKEVNYYDSMGGRNDECLAAIQEYLKAECLDKKKTQFNMDDWKLQNIKNIPQQQNGCDCGVFACQYAASITRNAKITFTQNDMPYFRKRMVYEILKKSLL